jgi:hypothetical protein
LKKLILAIVLFVAAAVQAEPLRVIAPSNGETLRGGRFATLAWNAGRLAPDAEEWEAFLSVDGGRFYSVRLTPHLDISIRRFDVLIPNVDSDDARILIRTGNERNETILTLPQRLRIRAEANAFRPSQTQAEGPESARPNEPRVVQWSVGNHVESAATPDDVRAVKTISESTKWGVGNRGSEERLPTTDSRLPAKQTRAPRATRRTPETSDVLLRSSRMNV